VPLPPALAQRASLSSEAGYNPQNRPSSRESQGLPSADPRKRAAPAIPDVGHPAKRRVIAAELLPVDPRRYVTRDQCAFTVVS
jgi:hypothetical protein